MFILFDSWPKMGFDFFSNVWLILTLLLYVKKKKVTFSPGFLFAELVIPDKANVFYAMSTTANFDFVLRQQRKGQKKVLRASASLSRLVKWPPPNTWTRELAGLSGRTCVPLENVLLWSRFWIAKEMQMEGYHGDWQNVAVALYGKENSAWGETLELQKRRRGGVRNVCLTNQVKCH